MRDIRYVLPLGIGIIMWVLVQSRLPSHHEQYPSQLTSIESWKNGFENIPLILKNEGIIMSDWPWLPVFLVAGIVLIFLRAKISIRFHGFFLTLGMIMVLVSIYIVTPWSFEIERFIQVTFPRLLLQILPPLFLSILVLVSNSSKRWIWVVPSIFLFVYAGPLLHHEVKMIEDISRSYKQDGLGTDRYLGNEIWVEALELDKKLPPRSSGVILDRREYFFIN